MEDLKTELRQLIQEEIQSLKRDLVASILEAKDRPRSTTVDAAVQTDGEDIQPPAGSNSLQYEDCSICQTTMDNDSPLNRTLPCGHRYHARCVNDWFGRFLHNTPTCPLCRSEVMQDGFPRDDVSEASLASHQEEPEYEVESIVGRSFDPARGTFMYRIRWHPLAGTIQQYSWEPEENLTNCAELLAAYEASHPRAPLRRTELRRRIITVPRTEHVPTRRSQRLASRAATAPPVQPLRRSARIAAAEQARRNA